MSDWWPPTIVHQLRLSLGYCPNDGTMGANFERGDQAEPERYPRTAQPALAHREEMRLVLADIQSGEFSRRTMRQFHEAKARGEGQ